MTSGCSGVYFSRVGAQFLLLLIQLNLQRRRRWRRSDCLAAIAILFYVEHGLQVHALLIRLGKRVFVGLHCRLNLADCLHVGLRLFRQTFHMRHLEGLHFRLLARQPLRCRIQLRRQERVCSLRPVASFPQVFVDE